MEKDVSFHKITTEQENAVIRNHTYLQDPTQVYKAFPNFSALQTKYLFHVSIVLVHNGQQSVVNNCESKNCVLFTFRFPSLSPIMT